MAALVEVLVGRVLRGTKAESQGPELAITQKNQILLWSIWLSRSAVGLGNVYLTSSSGAFMVKLSFGNKNLTI